VEDVRRVAWRSHLIGSARQRERINKSKSYESLCPYLRCLATVRMRAINVGTRSVRAGSVESRLTTVN
jgi:hypothetical protein